LYGYKEIYRKVYIAYLDNEKIIRVRDIRFYKGDILDKKDKRKTLPKVVFNKEVEKLIFGEVCFKTIFGSSKLPILRALKI